MSDIRPLLRKHLCFAAVFGIEPRLLAMNFTLTLWPHAYQLLSFGFSPNKQGPDSNSLLEWLSGSVRETRSMTAS